MKYSDHYILAKYMAKTYHITNPFHRIPFIIGNVLPDLNKFTYLQGYGRLRDRLCSLGVKLSLNDRRRLLIAGHTAEGSRYYVNKNTCTFRKKYHGVNAKKTGIIAWYRLGVMLHYVVDRFTYPHTLRCGMAFMEHVRYEEELHDIFTVIIEMLDNERKRKSVICSVREKFGHMNFDVLYRAFRMDGGKLVLPFDNCIYVFAVAVKYMDYVLPRNL